MSKDTVGSSGLWLLSLIVVLLMGLWWCIRLMGYKGWRCYWAMGLMGIKCNRGRLSAQDGGKGVMLLGLS